MLSDFPPELFTYICSFVSFEDVLRYRSVSKSFNNEILLSIKIIDTGLFSNSLTDFYSLFEDNDCFYSFCLLIPELLNLEELWIIDCPLTTNQIAIFTTCLSKLSRLKHLYLNNEDIDNYGTQFLFNSLNENKMLQSSLKTLLLPNTLNLKINHLEVFKKYLNIEAIDLNWSKLDNSNIILFLNNLQSTIKIINIGNNDCDDDCLLPLLSALKRFVNIEEFTFFEDHTNFINYEESKKAIKQVLPENAQVY